MSRAIEKPILFSPPMVQAILAGRKSQTRRVIEPGPRQTWLTPEAISKVVRMDHRDGWFAMSVDDRPPATEGAFAGVCPGHIGSIKPPYSVGDRLWVREAWAVHRQYDRQKGSELFGMAEMACVSYKADGPYRDYIGRSRHARFMPRWAARLFLEVTRVRVERLQDISEDDAKAEGIAEPAPVHGKWCDPTKGREGHWSYRKPYADLWNSLHGEGAWEANPWVWVYDFNVLKAGAK